MRSLLFPGAVVVVVVAVLTACSSTSAQQSKRLAPSDVVATVGSTSITLAEVDDKALQQPVTSFGSVKLAVALYQARRTAIDDLVATRLMDEAAKAQGMDRAALVAKEITSKIATVTEDDIGFWYQTNQARVQGASLDQVRQPIRQFLTQERMQVIRDQYLSTLKAKTAVRVMLEPPRQTVSTEGSPAKGPANAPIELVEFSDFQCPFCFRAAPTVNQVLSAYGEKIHFVYRNYPLPNHPNARPAAEAAACAADQGKFWQYHDRLFQDPSKLGQSDLKRDAADLGLDTAKFDACVDSRKLKATVDSDVQAGQEAGVDGTPAFFINGRMISGAQPFEVFKRIIDEELDLKRSR
jgi:protein-disulfide isomerase